MAGLIVHEWIEKAGGSEKVLEAMSRAIPSADLFCLWNDAPDRFADRTVRESLLARTPLRRHKAIALPVMPFVWRGVDLTDYDWALTSSHLFAHHVGTRSSRADRQVFAYVHTPARYIWNPKLDPRGQTRLARAVSPAFRALDKKRASEGTQFAANSHYVRQRIEDAWGQDARVIYPPVDVDRLQSTGTWANKLSASSHEVLAGLPDTFLLGASRFVAYKRLERVIETGEACRLPVVLAGGGPEYEYLKDRAGRATVPVHFIHNPEDPLLFAIMQRALAYIFPPIEDFGIMPVEAMALGTPTVVNAVGGAAESVTALDGGATFEGEGPRELRTAVERALAKDMTRSVDKACMFSEQSFINAIRQWVLGSGNLEPNSGRP